MRTHHPTTALDEQRVPVRFKLAAAWTSFMFLYVYVDILAFYKPGVVTDILAGTVWRLDITQTWAITALSLLAIPILMVVLSTILPARASRIANLIAASVQIPFAAFNAVGEFGGSWMYSAAWESHWKSSFSSSSCGTPGPGPAPGRPRPTQPCPPVRIEMSFAPSSKRERENSPSSSKPTFTTTSHGGLPGPPSACRSGQTGRLFCRIRQCNKSNVREMQWSSLRGGKRRILAESVQVPHLTLRSYVFLP